MDGNNMDSHQWKQFWDNVEGVGLARIDMDGRVITCNRAFGSIIGRDCVELEGMQVDQFTAPEDRGATARKIRAMVENGQPAVRTEKRYMRPNGLRVWCQLNSVMIRNQNGTPLYVLSSIYEIPSGEQGSKMIELSARLEKNEELISSLMRLIDSKQTVVNVGADDHSVKHSADHGGTVSNQANNSATLLVVIAIVLGMVVVGFVALLVGGHVELKSDKANVAIEGNQ